MAQQIMAKYFQVKPASKKQSAQLTSSNSIVGDQFLLKINTSKQKVTIINKFDFAVAEIIGEDAKQIILWHNKGLNIVAMLAYVTYCEPKSEHAANFLICAYPEKEKIAYSNFFQSVSAKLSDGNMPDIKLDKFEQDKIVKTNGDYKITKFLPKPKFETGTVILKSKQTFTEKIIEAGRQKNPGCYIASIVFILIVVGFIIWIIYNMFI